MAHLDNKTSVASGMMGPGMMDMGKGMMGHGVMDKMPGMMQMSAGLGREVARGTTKVVVISGSSKAGNRVIGKLVRHPLVILGLGFAAGYLIHKYRNDIISSSSKSSQ